MFSIVYASTSGSTRLFVNSLSEELSASGLVHALELGRDDVLAAEHVTQSFGIAITPSYGLGDWHFKWHQNFDNAASYLMKCNRVACIGLGDSRGHGKTFCGGLGVLFRRLGDAGVNVVGKQPAAGYDFIASPALIGNEFPGLPIEYRKMRRTAAKLAADWLREAFQVP